MNNHLNVLYWEELVQLFNEEFIFPEESRLSSLSEITFKIGYDVVE